MRIAAVCICFLLTVAPAMSGGIPQHGPAPGWYPLGDYWASYWHDTARLAKAPAGRRTRDWLGLAAVAATASGMYVLDDDLRDWAQDKRDDTSDTIALFAEPLGSWVPVPALGVLYGYGHLAGNVRARRAALLGLESLLLSGAAIQVLKQAGHRHRPRTDDPFDTWDGPDIRSGDLSFPSGHSGAAFAVATAIATEYSDYPAVPCLLYPLAALVAWSRVNDDAHWASDAFVGSVIGFATARALACYHDSESRLALHPVTLDGVTGAGLTVSW